MPATWLNGAALSALGRPGGAAGRPGIRSARAGCCPGQATSASAPAHSPGDRSRCGSCSAGGGAGRRSWFACSVPGTRRRAVRSLTGVAGGRRTALGSESCGPFMAAADAEGRIDWRMVCLDSTSCRANQHAAGARPRSPKMAGRRSRPPRHRPDEALGRSRGGLTCKIHLVGEAGCRLLAFVITPGQWGDAPQLIPVLEQIRVHQSEGGHPRTRPNHLGADKARPAR